MKVELVNRPGAFVTVDEADYVRLTAERRARWSLNEANNGFYYVRFYVPGELRRKGHLAREISGAQHGQRVSYRNGDRLDLRRTNLVLHDPARTKPVRVIVGSARNQDMVALGTMGLPEATSGFAFCA